MYLSQGPVGPPAVAEVEMEHPLVFAWALRKILLARGRLVDDAIVDALGHDRGT